MPFVSLFPASSPNLVAVCVQAIPASPSPRPVSTDGSSGGGGAAAGGAVGGVVGVLAVVATVVAVVVIRRRRLAQRATVPTKYRASTTATAVVQVRAPH